MLLRVEQEGRKDRQAMLSSQLLDCCRPDKSEARLARFAERGEGLINAPDTDPHHQGDLVVLAKSIRDELGVTILFSAHELNPLLGALDRVLYFALGQAALGAVDDVITGPVRSRLYGAEIDVVRLKGRIFIMSGGHDVERNHCRRDNGSRDTHIRRLLGAQPSDV
jgi:hypothetical protein